MTVQSKYSVCRRGDSNYLSHFFDGSLKHLYRLLKLDEWVILVNCCLAKMMGVERFCSQFCSHWLDEPSSRAYGCCVREGSLEKGENQSLKAKRLYNCLWKWLAIDENVTGVGDILLHCKY